MITAAKVAKNSAVVLGAKVISSLLLMAMAVLLARSLGAESFGVYSFVFAYIAFFNVLADLGLKNILVREISRAGSGLERLVANAIVMRVALSLLALASACLVFSLLSYPFSTKLLVYIASLSFISTLSLFYEAIFQARFKMEYAAGINILDSILKLAIFSLLVVFKAKLIWFVLATVVAPFPGFFIAASLSRRLVKLEFKLDFKIWKNLLKESWPLALTAVFIVFYMRIDQIMLFTMRGAREVGYYAAGVRFVEAFNILPLAFMASVFPLLSRYFVSSKEKLKETYTLSFKYLAIAIIPIAMGVCLLTEPIVQIIYGSKFLPLVPALRILIWSEIFAFLGVAHVNILISVGLQKLDFIFTLSGAVVNIILNLLLIPAYGIIGASLATVISYGLGVPLSCALPKTRAYGRALVASLPKPLIAASLMGVFTYWAFVLGINLAVNIAISIGLYFGFLILIKGLNQKDRDYFKKILVSG